MKTEKDIREFRDGYIISLSSSADTHPELIRRYKFAVNLLSYVLDEPASYSERKDFDIPESIIIEREEA